MQHQSRRVISSRLASSEYLHSASDGEGIAPMPNEARLRLISRADAGWSRPRGTDAQAPSASRHEGRRALRGSHAKDEAAAMQPRSQLQEG